MCRRPLALVTFLTVAISGTALSSTPQTLHPPVYPAEETTDARSVLGIALPIHLRLDDFTVTTDSVVATATVRYSGAAKRVTVRWGDGTESRKRPLIPGVSTGPVDTFQHVYSAPKDGKEFMLFATASIEDWAGSVDLEVLSVVITPRYEVIQYQASFRALDNCDSLTFESTAEYVITQTVSGDITKTWRFDDPLASIIPGPFRPLDGSILRREFTALESPVDIAYKVVEDDPFSDDNLGTRFISATPGTESAPVNLNFSRDCAAEMRFDVEVNLLKPGLLTDSLFPNQFLH